MSPHRLKSSMPNFYTFILSPSYRLLLSYFLPSPSMFLKKKRSNIDFLDPSYDFSFFRPLVSVPLLFFCTLSLIFPFGMKTYFVSVWLCSGASSGQVVGKYSWRESLEQTEITSFVPESRRRSAGSTLPTSLSLQGRRVPPDPRTRLRPASR